MIVKFLIEVSDELIAVINVEVGDILMFGVDKFEIVAAVLGVVCICLGKELGLIDELKFNFLWIVDWLLFEYDEEVGCYVFVYYLFI